MEKNPPKTTEDRLEKICPRGAMIFELYEPYTTLDTLMADGRERTREEIQERLGLTAEEIALQVKGSQLNIRKVTWTGIIMYKAVGHRDEY